MVVTTPPGMAAADLGVVWEVTAAARAALRPPREPAAREELVVDVVADSVTDDGWLESAEYPPRDDDPESKPLSFTDIFSRLFVSLLS